MDKDIKDINYELMLEAYTRHLEEEEEIIKKTASWLNKRAEYEKVISSLIYDGKAGGYNE